MVDPGFGSTLTAPSTVPPAAVARVPMVDLYGGPLVNWSTKEDVQSFADASNKFPCV
jgi:hypothetical protein